MYLFLDPNKVEFDGGDNVSKFDNEIPVGESLPLAVDDVKGELNNQWSILSLIYTWQITCCEMPHLLYVVAPVL